MNSQQGNIIQKQSISYISMAYQFCTVLPKGTEIFHIVSKHQFYTQINYPLISIGNVKIALNKPK